MIAWGREPDVLLRLAAGEIIGTLLVAHARPSRRRASAGWPTTCSCAARSIVDDGAALKLRDEGKSLLPIGIAGVEGDFHRGDVIAVRGRRAARLGADWPTTRRPRRG